MERARDRFEDGFEFWGATPVACQNGSRARMAHMRAPLIIARAAYVRLLLLAAHYGGGGGGGEGGREEEEDGSENTICNSKIKNG